MFKLISFFKVIIQVLAITSSLFFSVEVLANQKAKEVAKAIILRGEVYEVFVDEKGKEISRALKIKDNIHEGAIIRSDKSGFVKLLFFDKSQMMISPNSSVEIKAFTKQKAGIIGLLKGKIRSKVTKDRMNISNNQGSKLFVKTKTAAMGVRGTDFQVIYNPENTVTSLLTFEGAVAMAKLNGEGNLNQTALESRLNSDQAVMVRRGQYSGSLPGMNRVSLPVKISPAQLEVLRGNENNNSGSSSKNEEGKKKDSKKVVRSTVPPGLNAKKVTSDKEAIIKKVAVKNFGTNLADINNKKLDNGYFENVNSDIPPEGMTDAKSGAFAPPAGGYIDSKTGLYIPPGKGDAFDPNAKVYVPSPSLGGIDPISGDYIPPEGTKLADNGELIKMSTGRGPASISDGGIVLKNMQQNEFLDPSLSNSEANTYYNQTTGSMINTGIDFKDYQNETTIDYNNNTNIFNDRNRTREVKSKNIEIKISR